MLDFRRVRRQHRDTTPESGPPVHAQLQIRLHNVQYTADGAALLQHLRMYIVQDEKSAPSSQESGDLRVGTVQEDRDDIIVLH